MSEKAKQIEWYLDELDCANCASKVETGIAKIEGILESNVNFMTKTLRIVIEEDQEAEILPKVKQKLSVMEPDIHPTLKKSGEPIGVNGLPLVAAQTADAKYAENVRDDHGLTSAEEHQCRFDIIHIVVGKFLCPGIFCIGQHDGYKFSHLVLSLVAGFSDACLWRFCRRAATTTAKQVAASK